MVSNKTHYEKTSADTKELGFEFQHLCFIDKLLNLEPGQIIYYEEKDDINIETSDGKLTLIQVKHSIQTDSKNETINLTELDIDLWKTLYNWTKIITDENCGRKKIKEQKQFLDKTNFVLMTNKKLFSNPVIIKIGEFQHKKIKCEEFEDYLKELQNKTKPHIGEYISTISKLDKNVFEKFIKNITTEQITDIVDSIKQKIRNKMVALNKVNNVFDALYSQIKIDFFDKVKKGEKQSFSHKDFIDKYTNIFVNNNVSTLKYASFTLALPDKLEEQFFIKELIEIGELQSEYLDDIAERTEQMLQLRMNIDEWYKNNELTNDEIENFHSESFLSWKNNHNKHHYDSNENNDNINAHKCLHELLELKLTIQDTELNIGPSNGEFYNLSNEKRIGWKKHWQKQYKK